MASVRTGNDVERAFLEHNGAMSLHVDELRTLRSRIEARRASAVSRGTGALIDEDEPPPSVDFGDIRAKYDRRLGGAVATNGQNSRYTNATAHLSVLLVELGGFSSGADAAGKMVDRVASDVASLRATGRYPPGLRVGFAGDAAISAEELRALRRPSPSWSSVVVVLAVMAAIIIYFRWWPSVLAVTVAAPAGDGVVCFGAIVVSAVLASPRSTRTRPFSDRSSSVTG